MSESLTESFACVSFPGLKNRPGAMVLKPWFSFGLVWPTSHKRGPGQNSEKEDHSVPLLSLQWELLAPAR